MSRKKKRAWYPGIYEGKTPEQVAAQVGAAAPKQFLDGNTPRSMRAFNPKSGALRQDGHICKSLNGL